MAVQTIITHNHPTLRKESNPVTVINNEIKGLITDLLDTLANAGDYGVGLSANQIDHTWRVFVARIYPDGQSNTESLPQPDHFINPEIIKTSNDTNASIDEEHNFLEGCLSLPDIFAFVERPLRVTLRYHTLETLSQKTDPFEKEFELDNSIVVQHELDHLNGILFTDHALSQGHPIYEIKKGDEPRKIDL